MKIRIGLYCGAKLLRIKQRRDYGGLFYDWKVYGLFRKLDAKWFFSIGPVLFWDGS